MVAISPLAGASLFANAPAFFPIYGAVSLGDAVGEAATQGQELRSLLNGFGIKRKEAAKTLSTTRGEILRWCWGVHRLPQGLLSNLKVAPGKQEALSVMAHVREGHWAFFQESHPFWKEALDIRQTMRAWNLSAEEICDATDMSPDAFRDIFFGSSDPGIHWKDALRQLHDLKRYRPYWREGEKLRTAMEKWGVSVADIKNTTQWSGRHIRVCWNGTKSSRGLLLAFQDALSREEILKRLADLAQERRERGLLPLSFPFCFDNPHNRMVRETRLRLKMTRKEMAFALRVDEETISNWERGFCSVSPPARPRVEMAARMETAAALRSEIKRWNPEPLKVPTPNRPLKPKEKSFVQELCEKNASRIRHIAYGSVSRNRKAEAEDAILSVMEEIARLVLSKRISRYIDPMTGLLRGGFIRGVMKNWFSDSSLLARGLKTKEQIFLNRIREVERQWRTQHGRMITPEEFAQEFRVTVTRAERLLEEYRLLSQARPVSYDTLQFPLASE